MSVTVLEKRVIINVIKLRPLRCGDDHGLCGLVVNAITCILIRRGRGGPIDSRGEGTVTTEAEAGVT